jgi:hypothetical protein
MSPFTLPSPDVIRQRVTECERELRALRRLQRAAQDAQDADDARQRRRLAESREGVANAAQA